MLFTTSWDDGHPLDQKLADLLDEFSVAGTFYCPIRNREGLPVLDPVGMRSLSERFELGSHTLNHVYATDMSPAHWRDEVFKGKAELESILGRSVSGFCFPGGKMPPGARQIVVDAGFTYARTTGNLWTRIGDDRFVLPTTLQFYPHSRAVLMRNLFRQGRWGSRISLGLRCLMAKGFMHRFDRLLSVSSDAGGDLGHADQVVHVWGHSWEIEELDLWEQLRQFLSQVVSRVSPERRLTNGQLVQRLMTPDDSTDFALPSA